MAGSAGAGDAVEIAFEIPHYTYNPQSINVVANDFDPDAGDNPLTVVSVNTPARGSVSTDGTNVTFDPGSDFAFLNDGQSATEVITYTLNTGATGTVTFTIYGESDPFLPPIVIDIDGDGVEFRSLVNGIEMDVDGDGFAERTAWADEDDAVLIFDANNNNDVDGLKEFAFATYSSNPDATDLEGLREAFDSNNDGILSADDDSWSQFKLWQDADGDGLVGEGEMISLDEAGIQSISLISDGNAYYEANGDVFVHGESEVIYTDGSVGIAADAEFSYTDLIDSAEDSQDLEIVTSKVTSSIWMRAADLIYRQLADTPASGFDNLPESGPSHFNRAGSRSNGSGRCHVNRWLR